ncbi:MAG: PKD domain-containing protein [Saprospiraceae bacterium]|nr:PKD domain-containing protein [Saprospiraceae bacterium]
MRYCALTLLFITFLNWKLQGQLTNGATAPDFSVTDINGNSWSLYSEMSGGKSACLDFSATWCGPCWSFHKSHVLNQVNSNLSNYTTVLFLEADLATNTNCLYNLSPCNKGTQGNWVTGTTYPITDLSSTNGVGLNGMYNISYFPTLYVISPDYRVWNIQSRTYQEYYDWIVSSFSLNATETIQHSTCGDNGSITMSVTGGLGTKKYKWSNGSTSKDLTAISGGTYKLTITDAQGYFKSFGPFVVDGPQRRVTIVSSQKSDNKCFGETNGSIKLSVAYGTPGYNYQWSNGETGSQLNKLPAGSYTVTVTDAVNCTTIATYYISEPLLLTTKITHFNETCESKNGFISIVSTGGISPYTYWLDQQKSNIGSFSKLKEGEYTVKVTDLNQCETSDIIQLTGTKKPKLKIIAPQLLTCEKDTIVILGQDSDNGSEFVSEWKTHNGKIIDDKYNLNIRTTTKGTYELKIINTLNNCSSIDSVIIQEDKKYPEIHTKGIDHLNCYFPETELVGETSNPRSLFFWTKLNSIFRENKSRIVIADSGYYVFHVKDTVNFCLTKDTIVVTADKTEPVVVIDSPESMNCKRLESIIHADQSELESNYELLWYTSNGNFVSDQNTLHPKVNKAGTYVLKLINLINGCEKSAAVEVLQNTELAEIKLDTLIEDLSCIRPTIQIKTKLSDDYEIKWTTNDGNIRSGIDQNSVEIDKEGDYQLYYRNIYSECEKKIEFNIQRQNLLNPKFQFIQNELEISLTDLTEGIVLRREWKFNDGTLIKDLPTAKHTFQSAGEYQICLEVENECGVQTTCMNISVVENGVLNLASWNIHPVSCFGGNDALITLSVQGGKEPYQYIWSNGQNGRELSGIVAGVYTVTVTDALNSKTEKTFVVTEPNEINLNHLSIKHENSGFNNGSILVKIAGGIPGYQYLWSNSQTGEEIFNLSAGNYSLTVTDANQCVKVFGPFEVRSLSSVLELQEKIEVKLEPNPVFDEGRIVIDADNLKEQKVICLIDPFGRLLSQNEIVNGINILPMKMGLYPSGLYCITVQGKNTIFRKIWIKI